MTRHSQAVMGGLPLPGLQLCVLHLTTSLFDMIMSRSRPLPLFRNGHPFTEAVADEEDHV